MTIKFTKKYLERLENIFASSDFILRYEKGNFKSGYCILKDTKVIIVNKYFPLEGKINALLDILLEIKLDPQAFKEKSDRDFLQELQQREIKF